MLPFGNASSGPRAIYVVAVAYGGYRVRRHGHASLLDWVAGSGATGLEVRRELFAEEPPAGLAALGQAVADARLQVLYSAPEPLFDAAGQWRKASLQRLLAEAGQLGAGALKLPLGRLPAGDAARLAPLAEMLRAASAIRLLIENDQTAQGGQVAILQNFFQRAASAGLPLGMTFDFGNWLWQQESPLQAAECLASHVQYVHLKGVQGEGARRFSVPLGEGVPDWRAVLARLPARAALGLEFPLLDGEPLALTQHYVALLRDVTPPVSRML